MDKTLRYWGKEGKEEKREEGRKDNFCPKLLVLRL
jgi:hypothetical protein